MTKRRDTPGDVRMLDVAAAAGVSRSTVSNVLRGREDVAEDLRLRVLEHADRLGYVYNRGAAGLRMRQSQLVGLVIPDIANPFISEAVRGAHEVLAARGYLVATIETGDDVERQAVVLRSLAEHRVDGFLLLPALGSVAEDVLATLAGLPAVILNRDIGAANLPYVGPDEESVGRLGAEHLISTHGCSSIAYFGGSPAARPRVERAHAFGRYAAGSDVDLASSWSVPCEASPAAAYEIARDLLVGGDVPAGVMCHSDTIAYGLLRALRASDVSSERCRVIGCDDLPDSAFWNPSLTSVSVDSSLIGRTAANSLLRTFGHDLDLTDVPAPHLILRESCGCPRPS
ncbi:LacI family DNA-binding transcriptional regulator [Kribbella sp. CA-245084]|uniref:LacI family DNA-binding transcriptional regulator n=1 Tax=Kribbella sp. CA-245084 TaxID=3239940 RepID=UPI003D909CDB